MVSKIKEKFSTKARRFWKAGGEDVYIHRQTGETYVPSLGGTKPLDENFYNYRKVTPEERKRILNESIAKEKFEKDYSSGQRKKSTLAWLGRRKEGAVEKGGKIKLWGKRKGTGAYKKGKYAWRHKGQAVDYGVHATSQIGPTAARFGYALPSPFQVFTLAWQKSSSAIKTITILAFAFVILFIPWGIFYYTGWAMAAAFMFLISLIYWIFVNIFNGLASVLVTIINGIASIIMGSIIWIVEAIMDFFMKGDGWYWSNGHQILDGSLISYSQIANVPSLMIVTPPAWEGWMNTILIVKLFEHIPGLSAIFNAYSTHIGNGVSQAFANFVATADPWSVVAVALLPLAIFVGFLIYVYQKNKYYI